MMCAKCVTLKEITDGIIVFYIVPRNLNGMRKGCCGCSERQASTQAAWTFSVIGRYLQTVLDSYPKRFTKQYQIIVKQSVILNPKIGLNERKQELATCQTYTFRLKKNYHCIAQQL